MKQAIVFLLLTVQLFAGIKNHLKDGGNEKKQFIQSSFMAEDSLAEVNRNSQSFIYLTFGYYEFLNLGYGYCLNEDWGMAIKTNILFFKNDIQRNSGAGIGIKIHKRIFKEKKFRLFDTANIEASIGKNIHYSKFIRCNEIQLNVASEKETMGFKVYYSVGAGYSFERNNGGLITPVFKLGTIYHF